MYLCETDGRIIPTRRVKLPRPREVIELPSGDALIIHSTGVFNEFASKLAGRPVHGPAMLCSENEDVP